MLILAVVGNGAICSISSALPSAKTLEIIKNVTLNPTDNNVAIFVKAMFKEYKKAYKKGECDEAADYLRAALYFLKQNPKSDDYIKIKSKFDELLNKTGADTSYSNRLELAKNLYLENKLFASAYEFSTLLKEDYQKDVCYEYLGDIARALNTEEVAFEFYKNAVDVNPENYSAKYKWASILLYKGQNGLAYYTLQEVIEGTTSNDIINDIINVFTQKINDEPNNENNYDILGLAYQKLGQYDKTYKLLKKSLLINPNDIFLRYHLGNLLFDVKEYNIADEIYSGILEDNPYESQIRISRAKAYSVLGQKNKAIKDYQIVLAMYPTSLQAQYGMYTLLKNSLPLEKIVNLFYPLELNYKLNDKGYDNLGAFANKLGNTDDAIVFFKKSSQINPKSPIPYIELYKIYQLQGQDDKAKIILNKAYKLFPKNKEIVEIYSALNSDKVNEKTELALSYLNNGEYRKAITIYNQVEPKTPEIYVALANCYRQINDLKSAIISYKRAIAINPNDSEIYYGLGVAYFEAGNTTNAKKALRLSLSKNPKNIKSKKMLGYIEQKELGKKIDSAYDYYAKKDYMNALKHLNIAVQTYPNDPKGYYYRGLTKGAMGDFKGAVLDFRETIKIDRNYIAAYYNLAEALEKTGKKKEALYMYEKYLGAENTDKTLVKKAQQKVIELGEKYY